jgi:transcriptional regulator with PAS, ATPase and Fis domain
VGDAVVDDLKIRAAFEWRRSILLTGEPGVGKSRAALSLARQYGPERGPVVVMNAAELTEGLWEAQVFGHARGAFTGATKGTRGYVQLADGGVLIIDEIGEIPLHLQARLLRIIEEGTYHRIGEPDRPQTARFVVVAATNRDLEAEVKRGAFRRDLLDRLSTCVIDLAPLRDRGREEVEQLARSMIVERAESVGREAPTLTDKAVALLSGYHWPGNAREMRDVVEALITLGAGTVDAVRRVLGDRLDTSSDPLAIVVELIEQSGKAITLAAFAARSGCSTSTATRRLNGLVAEGRVARIGTRKRGARYSITNHHEDYK